MIEPTHIKTKELMFYFEEHFEFKGIHKSINLYKIYTNKKMYLVRYIVAIMLLLAWLLW